MPLSPSNALSSLSLHFPPSLPTPYSLRFPLYLPPPLMMIAPSLCLPLPRLPFPPLPPPSLFSVSLMSAWCTLPPLITLAAWLAQGLCVSHPPFSPPSISSLFLWGEALCVLSLALSLSYPAHRVCCRVWDAVDSDRTNRWPMEGEMEGSRRREGVCAS